MRKLKLKFSRYDGIAMGFIWGTNYLEKGVCFILPFFTIEITRDIK